MGASTIPSPARFCGPSDPGQSSAHPAAFLPAPCDSTTGAPYDPDVNVSDPMAASTTSSDARLGAESGDLERDLPDPGENANDRPTTSHPPPDEKTALLPGPSVPGAFPVGISHALVPTRNVEYAFHLEEPSHDQIQDCLQDPNKPLCKFKTNNKEPDSYLTVSRRPELITIRPPHGTRPWQYTEWALNDDGHLSNGRYHVFHPGHFGQRDNPRKPRKDEQLLSEIVPEGKWFQVPKGIKVPPHLPTICTYTLDDLNNHQALLLRTKDEGRKGLTFKHWPLSSQTYVFGDTTAFPQLEAYLTAPRNPGSYPRAFTPEPRDNNTPPRSRIVRKRRAADQPPVRSKSSKRAAEKRKVIPHITPNPVPKRSQSSDRETPYSPPRTRSKARLSPALPEEA